VNRVIQPRQSIRLPYLQAKIQRLDIAEAGENGRLHASVTIDFAAKGGGYCWPYVPPKVDLHLWPRAPWR